MARGLRRDRYGPDDAAVSFQGELVVRRMADGRRKLVEPLVWDDGVLQIEVPAGFETDFSSVPRVARLFMPRFSKLDLAGVIHDRLYEQGYPRVMADQIWRYIAAQTEGGNAVQRWLGWSGLRAGGWVAYRQHRKRRAAGG